tara:strand:- start:1625 stop:1849 length:225 start_codon:yes stop_codon:yes gene_type:complete
MLFPHHHRHLKHLVVSLVIMKFLEHIIERTFLLHQEPLSVLVINRLNTLQSLVVAAQDLVTQVLVAVAVVLVVW